MTSVQVFNGAIAGHQHSLTTSRIVASSFGKRHDHVLRAVADLECSEEFRLRNFGESSYRNAQNKPQPEYQMTRDGFMFLAMGFTGARAAQMKELFIAAFNDMETALARRAEADVQRLAQVIAPELLRADPRRRQLVRYRRLGLTMREIQRLTGRGRETLNREYRLLEACGLIAVDAKRLASRQTALTNLARIGRAA